MDPQYRAELKRDAIQVIGNSLDFGPVIYRPPTQEEADSMQITLPEAVKIYHEALAHFGLVEIKPGLWHWQKNP